MTIKKGLFIGIIAGAVAVSLLLGALVGGGIGIGIGIAIGNGIAESQKPKTVELTADNFNEYFTYSISGSWYNGSYGDGEIIITFFPLKNVTFENAGVTVRFDDYEDGHTFIYEVVSDQYTDYITRSATIPYEGEFSIKISSFGDNEDANRCIVAWYNIDGFYASVEQRVKISIDSAYGEAVPR